MTNIIFFPSIPTTTTPTLAPCTTVAHLRPTSTLAHHHHPLAPHLRPTPLLPLPAYVPPTPQRTTVVCLCPTSAPAYSRRHSTTLAPYHGRSHATLPPNDPTQFVRALVATMDEGCRHEFLSSQEGGRPQTRVVEGGVRPQARLMSLEPKPLSTRGDGRYADARGRCTQGTSPSEPIPTNSRDGAARI